MSQLFSKHWKDYELIDAGGGKKLERWGRVVTIRPERNAYFKAVQTYQDWKQHADFEFVEHSTSNGEWLQFNKNASREWVISYHAVKLKLQLTRFKHLGIFPEQQANWDYIENQVKSGNRFLNLFGYTGAASLIARKNGADVFHCDSVKQIISWGKESMQLSGLADIHWVLEDALKFAQREVKRGNKYNGIIMDPPAFGIGTKNERWKIEDKFQELLVLALKLKEQNGFIIINTYSPRLAESEILGTFKKFSTGEKIKVETLCLRSTSEKIIEYGQRTLITD